MEYAGLGGISPNQTRIFSDPDRVDEKELKWICEYHGIKTERVVTVGYYALVRLDKDMVACTQKKGAIWTDVDSIHSLIMDHYEILSDALSVLYKEMIYSPVAFELLPKRFTIRAGKGSARSFPLWSSLKAGPLSFPGVTVTGFCNRGLPAHRHPALRRA